MNDFKSLFLNDTPLLDLRSPIEYHQGAFPNSKNIALLTDLQRQRIGTIYKKNGQAAAVKLGHKMISGDVKKQLIEKWLSYCHKNKKAHLYCFRGGMRSHLVQQWLCEKGLDIPLIEGGYKALRNYLLNVLEQSFNLIRMSGQTGVGKTDLLLQMADSIDLEGLANHRGSAFGKNISEQPSQINFENNLAIELLKQTNDNHCPILIEDESRCIGSINIPNTFMQTLQSSPVLILTCPLDERINRIYQEYIVEQLENQLIANPKKGVDMFNNSLLSALKKIQKRLGGVRFKKIQELMQCALKQNSETQHKQWIGDLLVQYYDPMYAYQLEKKSDKIIFTGNKLELKEYISENSL